MILSKSWLCLIVISFYTIIGNSHKDYSYLGDMVLLCAMGRSGSGFLLRVLGNLAGPEECKRKHDRPCITHELFELKDANITNPKKRVIDFFDKIRRKAGPKPIIGSKWKPYTDNQYFDKAWQWVADMDIPVILSIRNPLDVHISRRKNEEATLSSHCAPGDDVCLQQHLSVKVHIDPETARKVIDDNTKIFHNLRQKFVKMRIRYFEMTYEQITFGTDEEKLLLLQAMADFFIPRTRKRHIASLQDIYTDIVPTANYNQSKSVLNFDEVYAAFIHTPYAQYLHP